MDMDRVLYLLKDARIIIQHTIIETIVPFILQVHNDGLN